jgi:hypothetical protein
MKEEEEAWRAKERRTFAPCDDEWKPNQKPGNVSGTDQSEEDDEEIIPGCYALEINNDGIWIKSIWVRVSAFLLDRVSGVLMNVIGRIYTGSMITSLNTTTREESTISCRHWTA